MSAVIAPEIKKQYLDANGDPLSGGKLYVYESGTTTETTSYTSEVADTANANPIILNSSGEVGGLFLNAGSYKFVLTDADDVTIWTQDNITIRDFGTEIDALSASVTLAEASTQVPNRIISGAMSSNSSAPRYLVPIGTSNQLKILATTTDLVYSVNGTQNTLSSDTVASGLITAPTSNNTALINYSTLSDQDFTKTLGMNETNIPYDNAGSEITNRDGELAAFKIAGASTEYFIARIDNTNSRLINAQRGLFTDKDSAHIAATEFSNNDTLTLMKLTFIYLTSDGLMTVSYTEPTYSTTQPVSPADGDMWYDLTNKTWKRFNSTSFISADATYIGMCIQDENGNTVGAVPEYFYSEYSDVNTFEVEYLSATQVRSSRNNNKINVNGVSLSFNDSFKIWDITTDLEDGESENASDYYHFYIKENGDSVVSPYAPIDLSGRIRGKYHPFELWRYVGSIFNNSSSNFDSQDVIRKESVSYIDYNSLVSLDSDNATYDVKSYNSTIITDGASGPISITLPTAKGAIGKKYSFKRLDIFGGVSKTFTDTEVTIGTENIEITGHNFPDLKKVQVSNAGGALPTGLSTSTDYYVIYIDANNIKLASSKANAISDTAINITAASGGGTHTVTPQESAVTINTSSSETIDGDSSLNLYGKNESLELISDDSNWIKLNHDLGDNFTESEIVVGKLNGDILYKKSFQSASRTDGTVLVSGVAQQIKVEGWSQVGSFRRMLNHTEAGSSAVLSRVEFDHAAGEIEINSDSTYTSEFSVWYTK